MGDKLLAFAVWRLGKVVVRRKLRSVTSPRNVAIAGVVGVAVVRLRAAGRTRE